MLRHCFILIGLFAATTLSGGGCRSCSDCHDYDGPVPGCECSGYGQRTGSVSCGCGCGSGSCGTAIPSGSSTGCGCGHCGGGGGDGYYEGDATQSPEQSQPAQEEVGA